jgi:hypothetical protein
VNLHSILYLTQNRQPGPHDLAIGEKISRVNGAKVKFIAGSDFQHQSDAFKQKGISAKDGGVFIPELIINASGIKINSTIPTLHCNLFDGCRNKWYPRLTEALRQNKTTLCFSISLINADKIPGRRARIRIISHDYDQSRKLCLLFNESLLLETLDDYCNKRLEIISEPEPELTCGARLNKLLHMKLRTGINLIRHQWNKRSSGSPWKIGIIHHPLEEVALKKISKMNVQWINPMPAAAFNADPFGIGTNDDAEIVYESMSNGKGELRAFHASQGDRLWWNSDHHLSYPYTLFHEGNWYVLPEQYASNKVTLYRYTDHTTKPEPVANLVEDFPGVDPSLVFFEDKWWLFCSSAANKGADHRLYIFYSDHLCGPYKAHGRNPVKTDVCSARPAGHLFIHNQQLYRPAQDSGTTYGGNIVIHQIVKLSPDQFEEKEVNRITPGHFAPLHAKAVHTLSRFGSECLIDARIR